MYLFHMSCFFCLVSFQLIFNPVYSVQAHLEPLAIANNITQALYTQFNYILLTLSNLFYVYDNYKIDALVHASLQNSLEKH